MKRFCLYLVCAAILPTLALAQKAGNPFAGRWDITVTAADATYPGWLEVSGQGGKLECRAQPRSGSVRAITQLKVKKDRLTLTLTPKSKRGPATIWELTANGDQLAGTQKRKGSAPAQLAGVRAPSLQRDAPAAWSDPEPIFNGKDLSGWEPFDPATNHWVAKDGELVNETKGSNIRTTRKFDDYKLHIELNCPQGGNSGVYQRGRYEMQVAYETGVDRFHSMGAIYGFLAPSVELPRKPGEWESFDITLVGRRLTIVRDGVKVIDNQEIPGITGGALDSKESEPGPFYIQGDHTGGMKYRNITISVPKR